MNGGPAPDGGRPPRRRGLRFRVVVAFAVSGLLVTTGVSATAYLVTETYLLRQRQGTATQQAFLDARQVRDELALPPGDASAALQALDLPAGSRVVMLHGDRWYGSSVALGEQDLPPDLRELVAGGQPGRQRVELLGETSLVVGVPLPSVGAGFFEVVSLSELDRTLGTVRGALFAASVGATLAAALLGLWASGRVLRPLARVGSAAGRIAAGELDIRLDARGDPDLAALEVAFNSMVDALQQRIERDTRFVSDVSHELRSPLTTLATAAAVLRARETDLPERSQVALGLLLDEIDRFQRVVDELLELSRADAGVEPLDLAPLQLGELVLQAVARDGGEGAAVELAPDVVGRPVLADKRRLDRVLANLFENARTHGGGLARVGVTRTRDRVRIEVDDTGPGVPAAQREAIFGRFARGGASGRRGSTSGTGLGLALVAEHVALHGGTVHVEGLPGGAPGARFVVELPWREP